MLVLFLLQFPFHRHIKLSVLPTAVCVLTLPISDGLFSLPVFHLGVCSGIAFFPFLSHSGSSGNLPI